MKNIFLLSMAIFLWSPIRGQSVSIEEIMPLVGNWEGELTYANYSDGSLYSLPVELTFSEPKGSKFAIAFVYPNEPSANSNGSFKLSKDGRKIGGALITSVDKSNPEQLIVITEEKGKDNRRNAQIYQTYIISDKAYSSKKEVKYDGEDEKFVRNTISVTRT